MSANNNNTNNPNAPTIQSIGELQEVDPTVETIQEQPTALQEVLQTGTTALQNLISEGQSRVQEVIDNGASVAKTIINQGKDDPPNSPVSREEKLQEILTPGSSGSDNSPKYPSPQYPSSRSYSAKDSFGAWTDDNYLYSRETDKSSSNSFSFSALDEAMYYAEEEEAELSEYYEAIDSYYNYKAQYEAEKEEIKSNISSKHEDVSWRQRRNIYRRTKPKCINCKRNVGTIFKTEFVEDNTDVNNVDKTSRILKAMCGDDVEPCALDIQIMIPYTVLFDKAMTFNKELIKGLQNSIIKEKNNAIFGYSKKNDALNNYQLTNKALSNVIKDYENFMLLMEFITNNRKKNETLKAAEIALEQNIHLLRGHIEEFNNSGDPTHLDVAVSLYLEEMLEQLHTIESLKYMYQSVEFNTNERSFYLIQQRVNLPNQVYSSLKTTNILKYSVDNENLILKKKPTSRPNAAQRLELDGTIPPDMFTYRYDTKPNPVSFGSTASSTA